MKIIGFPEPTAKPTRKKRGVLFLSPEDMQEAKKSMKEKGIKEEDVKNLPPIEEIHGLNTPPLPKVVEVNSLMKFSDNDNPKPTPKPTPKKRGILFLSPEDMQEANKSMKEKGIKAEDVKNLPPIEEIMVLITRRR